MCFYLRQAPQIRSTILALYKLVCIYVCMYIYVIVVVFLFDCLFDCYNFAQKKTSERIRMKFSGKISN